MTDLCKPDGDRLEWPLLLQWMLQEQLEREQAVDRSYGGERILIPRLDQDYQKATGEKRATYGLYHNCLRETSGCLSIGTERFWLLSYEVPNQDLRRMQRADLLGLTASGGLAVFECKLGHNPYAPIASLLEGMDYLASLTSKSNFDRLQAEFPVLRDAVGVVPAGFENVEPTSGACHEVIVLAPTAYYEKYNRSNRGTTFGDLGWLRERSSTLRFGFATSETDADGFFSTNVAWSNLAPG
jgi:hypothetical protein